MVANCAFGWHNAKSESTSIQPASAGHKLESLNGAYFKNSTHLERNDNFEGLNNLDAWHHAWLFVEVWWREVPTCRRQKGFAHLVTNLLALLCKVHCPKTGKEKENWNELHFVKTFWPCRASTCIIFRLCLSFPAASMWSNLAALLYLLLSHLSASDPEWVAFRYPAGVLLDWSHAGLIRNNEDVLNT